MTCPCLTCLPDTVTEHDVNVLRAKKKSGGDLNNGFSRKSESW